MIPLQIPSSTLHDVSLRLLYNKGRNENYTLKINGTCIYGVHHFVFTTLLFMLSAKSVKRTPAYIVHVNDDNYIFVHSNLIRNLHTSSNVMIIISGFKCVLYCFLTGLLSSQIMLSSLQERCTASVCCHMARNS